MESRERERMKLNKDELEKWKKKKDASKDGEEWKGRYKVISEVTKFCLHSQLIVDDTKYRKDYILVCTI